MLVGEPQQEAGGLGLVAVLLLPFGHPGGRGQQRRPHRGEVADDPSDRAEHRHNAVLDRRELLGREPSVERQVDHRLGGHALGGRPDVRDPAGPVAAHADDRVARALHRRAVGLDLAGDRVDEERQVRRVGLDHAGADVVSVLGEARGARADRGRCVPALVREREDPSDLGGYRLGRLGVSARPAAQVALSESRQRLGVSPETLGLRDQRGSEHVLHAPEPIRARTERVNGLLHRRAQPRRCFRASSWRVIASGRRSPNLREELLDLRQLGLDLLAVDGQQLGEVVLAHAVEPVDVQRARRGNEAQTGSRRPRPCPRSGGRSTRGPASSHRIRARGTCRSRPCGTS